MLHAHGNCWPDSRADNTATTQLANTMTPALLGTKVGMTRVYDEKGAIVPVTVVQAGPCSVTQVKTIESDGYNAVQLGFAECKAKYSTFPADRPLPPRQASAPSRHFREIRLKDASDRKAGRYRYRRHVRRRAIRRRDRHQQRQGNRRRHEAASLRRPVRQPRHRTQAPLARIAGIASHLARSVRQAQEGRPHGRAHGHGPGHHPEPPPGQSRRGE